MEASAIHLNAQLSARRRSTLDRFLLILCENMIKTLTWDSDRYTDRCLILLLTWMIPVTLTIDCIFRFRWISWKRYSSCARSLSASPPRRISPRKTSELDRTEDCNHCSSKPHVLPVAGKRNREASEDVVAQLLILVLIWDTCLCKLGPSSWIPELSVHCKSRPWRRSYSQVLSSIHDQCLPGDPSGSRTQRRYRVDDTNTRDLLTYLDRFWSRTTPMKIIESWREDSLSTISVKGLIWTRSGSLTDSIARLKVLCVEWVGSSTSIRQMYASENLSWQGLSEWRMILSLRDTYLRPGDVRVFENNILMEECWISVDSVRGSWTT